MPITSINTKDSYDDGTLLYNIPHIGTDIPIEKKNKICSYFIKGICKHGISGKNCIFNNPKICKRLMKHGTKAKIGCNKGKKCDYYHPRMCPTSITKLECFDRSWQFYHIKGTKRESRRIDQHAKLISPNDEVKIGFIVPMMTIIITMF